MYSEYKGLLRERLDDYRYNHSLCVADEAKRLALKCGIDPEKAYLAGLLHDVTKNASQEEHLQIFARFDIILNDIEKNAKKLWHAISGAAFCEGVLGIKDSEIIDAIRYHTTAKANMSPLCKLLYLADFTSLDRNYPDVDVMRGLVDESFDKAFVYALQYTIKDLCDQKRAVHFDTLAAYNEAVTSLEGK
jgi:nicotinate-nucleotide adenylyltransferase